MEERNPNPFLVGDIGENFGELYEVIAVQGYTVDVKHIKGGWTASNIEHENLKLVRHGPLKLLTNFFD